MGHKPADLQYTGDIPCFKAVNNGKAYHAKRVVGGTARFYASDLEGLLKDSDHNNVVLVTDGGTDMKMMPARVLADRPDSWGGFKLTYVESNEEIEGENGTIVMPVTLRSPSGSNYRVNHFPMASLLVFRHGTYALSQSIIDGKMKFFIAFAPDMVT